MAANSSGVSNEGQEGASSRSEGASNGNASPAGRGRPTGDDILGLEEGQEPLFGVEEIEAAKSKAKGQKGKVPAPKKGGEVLRDDQLRARDAEAASAAVPSFEDLERAIGREVSPNAGPEDGDPEEGSLEGLSEKASSRFQELANRSKQSEARAQAAETAIGEMRQQFEAQYREVGNAFSQLQQQNAHLQGALQTLMRGNQNERLTPEEQIERELINRGVQESRKVLDPHIKQLTQRLDAAEKREQQHKRLAEVETNKARYSAEGEAAAREAVLSGFSDEEAKALGPTAQNWVLSYAWANRTSPKEAAKMVRRDIAKFSLAFVRAQARQLQSKRDQADSAPRPAPTPRGSGTGEAEPTFQQLRASGYRDANPFMEWELAGRPALTKKR